MSESESQVIELRKSYRRSLRRSLSAGHPAAIVLGRRGEVRHRMTSTCEPLGIDDTTTFCLGEPITLDVGDLVLAFTDGVPEAADESNHCFHIWRALEVVQAHQHESPTHIIAALHQAIIKFCGRPPIFDDISAAVIKRVG